jgi:hypothetical protein
MEANSCRASIYLFAVSYGVGAAFASAYAYSDLGGPFFVAEVGRASTNEALLFSPSLLFTEPTCEIGRA